MIIEKLVVGPIMANCFIVGCEETKEAAVIDPGDDADKILMKLAAHNLTVKAIINTHGHFDHVGGNRRLKEVTGADIYIHAEDAPMLPTLAAAAANWGLYADNSPEADKLMKDGDIIEVGKLKFTVLHTPGHTKGGISLVIDGKVFVGDTLFAGSIGRTDFPGGNFNTLISSIRNKLFTLDEKTIVYTGHGPETRIDHEKRTNPFAAM